MRALDDQEFAHLTRATYEEAYELAAEQGTETIMVVEDDDGVRALVQLMLEANGYEVFAVGDAESAERLCTERTVDLLLTDVVMPGLSGPNLAARLLQQNPHLRVLFMSGYIDEATGLHGTSWGVPMLQKPFTPAKLAEQVRHALDATAPRV